MSCGEMSRKLVRHLGLATPPVALAFVDHPPPDVPEPASEVPSACTFWRRAESEVFFAPAESHFNCPVGAMVMGFELPEAVGQRLMGLVEDMCGCSYLVPTEASNIPTMDRPAKGIVYGPLHDFPIAPDLILMWLTPRQAMLWAEAAGTSQWTESAPTAATGRPACAALPLALGGDRPSLSLGCTGMRTFTDIQDDRMLAVLPAGRGEEFLARLGATLEANQSMAGYYRSRKAQLAG